MCSSVRRRGPTIRRTGRRTCICPAGRQAGEAAAKAGVKSLALTHLPPWTWPDDMLAEAREVYDGPIRVVRRDEQIDIG